MEKWIIIAYLHLDCLYRALSTFARPFPTNNPISLILSFSEMKLEIKCRFLVVAMWVCCKSRYCLDTSSLVVSYPNESIFKAIKRLPLSVCMVSKIQHRVNLHEYN